MAEHQDRRADGLELQDRYDSSVEELSVFSFNVEGIQADLLKPCSIIEPVLYFMVDSTSSEELRWLVDNTETFNTIEPPNYVVPLNGNTGMGKSFLLNALLDASWLLPTNHGDKGCTSNIIIYTKTLANDFKVSIVFKSANFVQDDIRNTLKCFQKFFELEASLHLDLKSYEDS
jgi:hypothetical protein